MARRDKKAFLSHRCKEIEENNRMGKTRNLFKKITDTKGAFHAKMSSIKNRNSMDLTEAEDIKKNWQEYTEEMYKKDLHDPDTHDGVITHLESDILTQQTSNGLTWGGRNKNGLWIAALRRHRFKTEVTRAWISDQHKKLSKNKKCPRRSWADSRGGGPLLCQACEQKAESPK